VSAGGARSLEERLALRLPGLARALRAAGIRWLKPGSRLRRRLVDHILRLRYDALNRRDYDSLLEGATAAFELHTARDAAGGPVGMDLEPVYTGRAGFERFMQRWLDAWEDYRIELVEIVDRGDRFLALLRHRGRGRGSRVELDQPLAQLFSLVDGRLTRIDNFWDWDSAVEAVGGDRARGRRT